MKKLFVAVAALATMLFMSCNKEPNKEQTTDANNKEQTTDAKLQGTWNVKSTDFELYEDGKKINIPDDVQDIIDVFEDSMTSMSEGATLTFANGKATSTYTRDSKTVSDVADYTINGSTLTIKPNGGDNLDFTIKELTASNLVLTLNVDGNDQLKKLINNNKSYALLFVLTCTK